jgi:hypothetical protein
MRRTENVLRRRFDNSLDVERLALAAAFTGVGAVAACCTSRSASFRRIPWRRMRASRLLPRTYSITMKCVPIGRLDLVDRNDVRMVEGGRSLSFLHESATAVLVG